MTGAVKVIKSRAEFDALLATDKLFFVDFYADWCGPCRMISPVFEKIAEENTQEGAVEFYKLNIDNVEDLAEALGIQSIPRFHAYKGKKRVGEVKGADRDGLNNLVQLHAKQ